MKNKKGLVVVIIAFIVGVLTAGIICSVFFAEKDDDTRKKNKSKEKTTEISPQTTDEPEEGISSDVSQELSLLKVIDIPLSTEYYNIGVDKAQPELLDDINKIINKAKENGTINHIAGKYFGYNILFSNDPAPVYSAEEDPTKDQLIVATNASYAPFEYKSGEAYYGIDMEFISYVAKELGKELVIKDMSFDTLISAVENGSCDIVIAAITINEERKYHVNFTDSYYDASLKIITASSNHIFDDCKNQGDILKILNDDSYDLYIGYQYQTSADYYVNDLGNHHIGCHTFTDFSEFMENSCYIIDSTVAENTDEINELVNAMYALHEYSEQ